MILGTLIVIAIIVLVGIVMYNGLVRARNAVAQAWAGIDVQLKRRADLIPNLTQVVSAYTKHERTLLVQISRLRAQIITQQNAVLASTTAAAIAPLDTKLSESVKQLFAVAENYPKLQADKQYLSLQQELSNTENQIAASRRIYNENVTLYNTAIQSFPKNILASWFGFTQHELYTLVGK